MEFILGLIGWLALGYIYTLALVTIGSLRNIDNKHKIPLLIIGPIFGFGMMVAFLIDFMITTTRDSLKE